MSTTRNLRNATILIKDGASNTLEIPISSGDLAFTEKHPTFIIKNRGRIDSRKGGDEMETDVSFSFLFEQYAFASGAAVGISVLDALKGINGAATWVSTDACGPFSVNIQFKVEDPCNAGHYEILTFQKFHGETFAFKEGNEADSVAVSGNALVPAPVRTYV